MEKSWEDILNHEHRLIEKVLVVLEKETEKLNVGEGDLGLFSQAVDFFVDFADNCHHQKEERVLFPLLEKKGVPKERGPIGVMLLDHEEGRELVGKMKVAVDKRHREELGETSSMYIELLRGHIWKEDNVLYTLARRRLSPEEATQLAAEFEKVEGEVGEGVHEKYALLVEELERRAGGVEPLIKSLSAEIVDAMLDTLPLEITFVDSEDTVRYFNRETKHRIFSRTRAIIGRKVQQCHPERSVHLVNQILDDFKAGKTDSAEFWVDVKGRKIHIRYFAVRDGSGKYLGCMEVNQDITDIKKLEGEKRLL